MTSQATDSPPDLSLRARWNRRPRSIVPGVIVVLIAGAFLLAGPIGLGNGPLFTATDAIQSWTDSKPGPIAFTVPLINRGHAPAVVDGMAFIGGTKYPAPRHLAVGVVTTALCGGMWPARPSGDGFVLVGCGGLYRGALAGSVVGPTRGVVPGFPAAAEVTAPQSGSCWVITKVVVHYHVGIRHFTATDLDALILCLDDPKGIDAATNAAEAATS